MERWKPAWMENGGSGPLVKIAVPGYEWEPSWTGAGDDGVVGSREELLVVWPRVEMDVERGWRWKWRSSPVWKMVAGYEWETPRVQPNQLLP